MRKAIIVSVIFSLVLGLAGCKKPEPVQLIRFQQMSFGPMQANQATVKGEAVLYNPNSFSIHIKEIDLKIGISENQVATLNEVTAIKAEGEKEFVVPFQGAFDVKELQKVVEKDGISYLFGKKVPLRFTGQIKTNLSGWATKIPIDHQEEVSLNQLLGR